jgi:hypothetical protein
MSDAAAERSARPPRRSLPRRAWIAAIVCLVAVVVGLQRTSADLAFPRDEAIYFEASRAYGAWLDAVARSPGRALDAKARDRAFAVNHEHPPAMKLAAAVTAGLFARPPVTVPTEGLGADRRGVWPLLGESQALRLAAHLVAGVGVLLIVLAGTRRFGTVAGLVAAGAFILLPRVWFHAQLHTFDVPVTVAIFAVVLAWIRGRDDPRFGWLAGALLGLAVATKHNALFVGPLLLGHHFIALGVSSWRTRERPPLRALFPARVLASLTLAPLTFFALWPWLWRDSWARGLEWAVFHRDHAYYAAALLVPVRDDLGDRADDAALARAPRVHRATPAPRPRGRSRGCERSRAGRCLDLWRLDLWRLDRRRLDHRRLDRRRLDLWDGR